MAFGAFLFYAGRAYFAAMLLLLALNLFFPAMFWFDENGGYHAELARYIMLIAQILLFLLTSAYAAHVSRRAKDSAKNRYRIMGMFGVVTGAFIFLQLFVCTVDQRKTGMGIRIGIAVSRKVLGR